MAAGLRIVGTVAAALALPVAAWADVLCALGAGASGYNPSLDQRPSADTMQIVKRVDAAFLPFCQPKCPQAAMLRNDTAPNLMLTANQEGAKLVYAPQFFATAYAKYGEPALVALIAHVYAHAIDEVTRPTWIPGTWNVELRADAWAGCALAKTGVAPGDLSSALGALAMYPPPSQKAWGPRVPALRLGFTHCGGEAAKFEAAAKQVKAP